MSTIICPRCWGRIRFCDRCTNTGKIHDVLLSKNFTLGEFVKSETASKRGIANDPISKEITRLREMCENLLQPLRDALGPLNVSSGYRSEALNQAIKGSSKMSAHRVAYAADLVPEQKLEYIMNWFRETKLGFDQAILEPGWIHVGYKHPVSGGQRRELLQMKDGKYSIWA